jgi:hypothetical protein
MSYLRYVFIVVCVFAAIGPGAQVVAHLRARATAKRITQFGPLPEWPITWMDTLLGVCSLLLLIAAAMELVHLRLAAPLAFLATLVLWIYFGPGLWAHASGSTFFEPTPGYATSIPWQQGVYQVGATVCAAALTYSRYWLRTAA